MPKPTSAQPKKSEEWVEVAGFCGLEADMEADFCVTVLKGHRIPALRVPTNPVASLCGLGGTMNQPVRVLVPPDKEAEARELLDETD